MVLVTVPTPLTVARSARDLRESAARIVLEYRWVHGAAHARTVGEATRNGSGVNDPTGDVATSRDKAAMRKALTRAAKALESAQAELKSCEHLLRQATSRERERVEFEALRYPRTASRADMAESSQAQVQRCARGEGIPE